MSVYKSKRNNQNGFVLIGLLIALAVSGILSAIAITKSLADVETALAEGSGTYLSEVAGATEQFVFQNWFDYSNGNDLPGVATDLRPTINELIVGGKRLLPSFPQSLPTRQNVDIFITRTNCPGNDCLLTALVCTASPITFGRSFVRYDLAATMMTSQHGIGGQSRQSDPLNIVGPALNAPNPYGNVPGIVCASARVDTAIMMQFVRMGDTRDPFLRGDLTVKGTIGAGGDNSGACSRAVLMPDGKITSKKVDCSTAVEIDPAQSSLVANNVSGVKTIDLNGHSGRSSALLLRPTAAFVVNSSCSAGLEGDVALDANAKYGLLICRGSLWRRVGVENAISGGLCSPDGTVGQDANSVYYICRGGTWQSLTGRLPRSIPFQRYLVGDGTAIPLPTTCPSNTQPSILIRGIDGVTDNTTTPARNRFAHYAERSGSNWISRLVVFDSNGTRYSSTAAGVPYGMRAIAEVNCDFTN